MAEVLVNPAYPNMGIADGVDPALNIAGPFDLFAGEADIRFDNGVMKGAVLQHQVLMRNADNTLSAWDGSANKVKFVAAQAYTDGESGAFYTSAFFNHEALIWPAAVVDVAARKAAFDNTMISVGKVL